MPSKRISPDDADFCASAHEVLQQQKQETAEWCDRLAAGDRGGVRYCADQLIPLAGQNSELGLDAIDRLSVTVEACENDYNDTFITQTTKWDAALGVIVHLAGKFINVDDNKWDRIAQSLAFFADIDHGGQVSGYGRARVKGWLEETASANPRLADKVSACMAVPKQPASKAGPTAGLKGYPSVK